MNPIIFWPEKDVNKDNKIEDDDEGEGEDKEDDNGKGEDKANVGVNDNGNGENFFDGVMMLNDDA